MTENNDKGFTVTDRRAFNADGSPISDSDDLAGSRKIEESCGESAMPAVSFDTLIASLNASALYSLGLLEEPGAGAAQKNLEMARYTIDLLEMLEEKTKGNLSAQESEMLKNVLYDLRMIYVREKQC